MPCTHGRGAAAATLLLRSSHGPSALISNQYLFIGFGRFGQEHLPAEVDYGGAKSAKDGTRIEHGFKTISQGELPFASRLRGRHSFTAKCKVSIQLIPPVDQLDVLVLRHPTEIIAVVGIAAEY